MKTVPKKDQSKAQLCYYWMMQHSERIGTMNDSIDSFSYLLLPPNGDLVFRLKSIAFLQHFLFVFSKMNVKQ